MHKLLHVSGMSSLFIYISKINIEIIKRHLQGNLFCANGLMGNLRIQRILTHLHLQKCMKKNRRV